MTRLLSSGRPGSRTYRRRPEVEALEDRLVPANAAANLGFMARVELDVLHHPLDGLGIALARRLDHGASRAAVIRSFESSGAFQAALVNDAFVQILGHGADAAGLLGGLHFLRRDGSILDFEVRLAATDAFYVENGGTVDGFLAGLYRVGAGRAPGLSEQVGGDAALTRGESRLAVARAVLEGPAGLAYQADSVFVSLLRHHAEGGELGEGVFLISRHGLEGLIAAVLSPGEYYHLSTVHATHLVLLGGPGTQTAGVPFGLAAAAVDDLGQLDVTFTGPVTIGLGANPAGGSLQGTTTETATAGVAVFAPLTISKAGSGYTVVVSTPGLRGAQSGPFTVNPASADHLVFTATGQPPPSVQAGQGFTVQVAAEDRFGNVDTNYNGNVSLTIDPNHNPTGTSLQPTDPATATASQGIATFTNISINKANEDPSQGHYELLATAGGLQAGDSAPFDVTPGKATQLAFTYGPVPASVKSGQSTEVKVSAEDQYGNVDTTYAGAVTVSLASGPPGGSLHGTTTQLAQMGVADFPDLSGDKEGTYTLTASSGTLSPPSQDVSFSVTAAPATKLVWNGNVPQSYAATALQGVTLLAEDNSGNVDTSYNGQVTASLSGGTSGATLQGTNPVNAQGGHITFTDLRINEGGSNYVLNFSANLANGPATAQSNPFNVQGPGVSFTYTQPDPSNSYNMTFTATVSPPSGNSPAPMGNVTFFVDGSSQATTGNLDANGQASATLFLSPLPPNQSHQVRAQYNGDSNYGPASSATRSLTFHDDEVAYDNDGDETWQG